MSGVFISQKSNLRVPLVAVPSLGRLWSKVVGHVVPSSHVLGGDRLYDLAVVPADREHPQPQLRTLPMGGGEYDRGPRYCFNPILGFHRYVKRILHQ